MINKINSMKLIHLTLMMNMMLMSFLIMFLKKMKILPIWIFFIMLKNIIKRVNPNQWGAGKILQKIQNLIILALNKTNLSMISNKIKSKIMPKSKSSNKFNIRMIKTNIIITNKIINIIERIEKFQENNFEFSKCDLKLDWVW